MPVILTLFSIAFWIIRFFEIALLVWVILSWIPILMSRSSARWRYREFFSFIESVEHFLRMVVSPLLRLARRILPQRVLPHEWQVIDFSPIVAMLFLELLRAVLYWVEGMVIQTAL